MDKIIVSLFYIILVSLTIVVPFCLVMAGTICILSHELAWGIPMFIIGVALFWLIKPFSIITGKDFKIF